jgi:hypothetical protein
LYDGLIVPGTVAAFQREGTGGFVLTMSASAASPRYAIDPRFPLFQRALVNAKKSHVALAALLQDEKLIGTTEPTPESFGEARVAALAESWVRFNQDYNKSTLSKFEKYKARLGEDVAPGAARPPYVIMPLYTIAAGRSDPWWSVSQRLFAASAPLADNCVRVVAAGSCAGLGDILSDASDGERVVVWCSNLQELTVDGSELARYGRIIRDGSARGLEMFGLYGGFFSVMLGGVGLRGCSHGIGYGEARNWPELSQSGPPPARYYVRQLHRYMMQDLAYQLWVRDPELVACGCEECRDTPPLALDYHALMRHSVRVRADEVEEWANVPPGEASIRLAAEQKRFQERLEKAGLMPPLRRQVDRQLDHFARWIGALDSLAGN